MDAYSQVLLLVEEIERLESRCAELEDLSTDPGIKQADLEGAIDQVRYKLTDYIDKLRAQKSLMTRVNARELRETMCED